MDLNDRGLGIAALLVVAGSLTVAEIVPQKDLSSELRYEAPTWQVLDLQNTCTPYMVVNLEHERTERIHILATSLRTGAEIRF